MDCSNPPMEDVYFEGSKLPQVIHINKTERTCLVRIAPNRSVIAHLPKAINEAIQLLDYVELKPSVIPGQYNVVDYWVNSEVYNDEYYEEVLI